MKKSRKKNQISFVRLIGKTIVRIISFILLSFLIALLLPKASAQAPIGNYLELNGGHIKATTPKDNLPAGFTFEAWVKPQSIAGNQKILSVGDKQSGNYTYEVGINGGIIYVAVRHGFNSFRYLGTGNIASGVWSHLGVSISSSALTIFLNGAAINPGSGADNLLPIGDTVVLGDSYLEPGNSSNTFKGTIDEVRISRIARNINQLWLSGAYNSPFVSDADTLILWHLDEARGAVQTVDSSGNNYHGTLIGGDNKIHFYGVLPTPTPFSFNLPSLRWNRPILPTLSWPFPTSSINPPDNPAPTSSIPAPNGNDIRSSRPVFPR